MKKTGMIISFLLAVIILFTTAIGAFSAVITYIRGDADGDGDVSSIDLAVILRKLNDMPLPYIYVRAADINGDGLDITDATYIQRYLVEMPNPYHIGTTVRFDEYELPIVYK